METCADVNAGEDKGNMRDKVFRTFTPRCDSVVRILLPSLICLVKYWGRDKNVKPHKLNIFYTTQVEHTLHHTSSKRPVQN